MNPILVVMTGAINNLASSVSGTALTAHQGVREKREAERRELEKRRRVEDAFVPAVTETETAEAVRDPEDATQEQTREDHEEHASGYMPAQGPGPARPPLDLSA